MKRINFNESWTVRKTSGGSDVFKEATPVTLPHDAMIMEKRTPEAAGGAANGFFPGGDYEYAKKFTIPEENRGKTHFLQFEGIMSEAKIYVNQSLAASTYYGYTGKVLDITPYLLEDGENTVLVKVFAKDPGSRWYTGAGIYRPVSLYVGRDIRIPVRGVRVTTPVAEEAVSCVQIRTALVCEKKHKTAVSVVSEILDPEGNTVSMLETPHTFTEGSDNTVYQRLYIQNAKLWSTEHPALYTLKVSVKEGDDVLDEVTENFGIRTLSADPVRGLLINGEAVLLRGGCIHHDLGPLGAADFASAEERRIRRLKEAGFNAVRISHNSASESLLSACDRFGMLVLEESFDMWTKSKTVYDYARYFRDHWEEDLTDIVSKDYNHPSVIMYSIGNEITDLGETDGKKWSRILANRFRTLDPTRLVTNAVNGTMGLNDVMPKILVSLGLTTPGELADILDPTKPGDINDLITLLSKHMSEIVGHPLVEAKMHEAYEALDIVGLNYMLAAYEPMAKAYPNRVILGTEMTPPSIGKNWKAVKALPAVIGDFTWTAFDYIGEAGVGVVTYNGKNDFQKPYPCYLAYCGDFDITGFRRPLSYYREIVFGLRKAPYLAVQLPEHYEETPQHTPWALPDSVGSWTWPGFEGKPCRVEVYSNAPETELFINGKSVGKVTTGDEADCRAVLETIYEPGTIEAVSYFADGSEERFTLCTAADEWLLKAAPEREVFGVNELCYIPIELRDAAGNLNTAAACTVSVEVSGDGVLLGLASADPMSEEDFFASERKTFYGRALAIVKRTGEEEICVKICAEEQEKDLHL